MANDLKALRPRQTEFKFLGDTWLLVLRSSSHMAKLRMNWADVDRAVGKGRVLAGLTVPECNIVYIDQQLSPEDMVNILSHELYHVASCKRYKKKGEELRAVCFGEALEYLLRMLSFVTYEVPEEVSVVFTPEAAQFGPRETFSLVQVTQ